jgi:hypothetical protein
MTTLQRAEAGLDLLTRDDDVLQPINGRSDRFTVRDQYPDLVELCELRENFDHLGLLATL